MRKDLEKVVKLYKEKGKDTVRLEDCPVGLFVWEGALVLKTEYAVLGRSECYLVKSGEVFYGGVDTLEEYNNLQVTPIIVGYYLESDGITPKLKKSNLAEVYEDLGHGEGLR